MAGTLCRAKYALRLGLQPLPQLSGRRYWRGPKLYRFVKSFFHDLLDADKPHFSAWLWVRSNSEGPLVQPEAPPMYYVAGFGFRAMVDYLIAKRPEDLSVMGHYGIPLHASLYYGHTNVALLLLGHCVDVDVRGINDRTPLHMAASSGLLEVTRILIKRGASMNARDSSDRTPLHPTVQDRRGRFDDMYFDVMRYLLEHGANVDAQANIEHSTPLHLASYYGGLQQTKKSNQADFLVLHGSKTAVSTEATLREKRKEKSPLDCWVPKKESTSFPPSHPLGPLRGHLLGQIYLGKKNIFTHPLVTSLRTIG